MESDEATDFDVEQALADAERAAVAPWVDYPPTPWWYYPAAGAWTAAFVAVLTALDGVWLATGMALVIAAELGFVTWYKRYRGSMPLVTKPPEEFKPALRAWIAGAAVLLGVVAGSYLLGGTLLAAAVAFVGVTAGLYWYEKTYEAAAAATKRRLDKG